VFPLSETIGFKIPSKWYRRAVGALEISCGALLALIPNGEESNYFSMVNYHGNWNILCLSNSITITMATGIFCAKFVKKKTVVNCSELEAFSERRSVPAVAPLGVQPPPHRRQIRTHRTRSGMLGNIIIIVLGNFDNLKNPAGLPVHAELSVGG
jgi:hypothetical protein